MRWGILGLGIAGKARARALREDPRATLICGFGGDPASVDLPAAASVEALLEAVDAVAICSPDEVHPTQVRAALFAGKHVLCEYPLCRTAEEAGDLFALADRMGRMLHVSHIEVMTPLAAWLRGRAAGRSLRGGALRWKGPPRARTFGLAHANLARLHRLIDAVGEPLTARVNAIEPGRLFGELQMGRHATVELELSAEVGASRHLHLALEFNDGGVLVSGDHLFDRGALVTLPPAAGLFAADQRLASAILHDGALPLVPRERERALLRLAMMLSPPDSPPSIGRRRPTG